MCSSCPPCPPCPADVCNINRCFLCIPLNVACLILGYTQAVGWGMGTVVSFFILVSATMIPHTDNTRQADRQSSRLELSGYAVVCYFCGLALMFSAFLIHGVHKRKAGFVLMYLVYGVVTSILFVVVIGFAIGHAEGFLGLVPILAIYIHCLVVVYSTYRAILLEKSRLQPFAKATAPALIYQA